MEPNANKNTKAETSERASACSRREFLSSSTALAVAGAIGGLGGTISAAAAGRPEHLAPNASAPVQRIIIDTDPGVDDAIAILLALRSPELKVEAITPVSGNVPLSMTLPNALRLVEIAGRTDVPVAAGASHPLVRRLVTAPYVHGENGLGGVDFPAPTIKPSKESATEIIRRIVRANPGEITIVAVGPLTNVATALRSDPELAGMIKSLTLMGGSLSGGNITPAAEFNFYVDPEAARIVFDANIPLTMVGLDVTQKVLMRDEHIKQLEAATNPVSQAAGRIMRASIERMRRGNDETVVAMHDGLAMSSLIDPGILTLRDYYVEIETTGEWTAGESVGYRSAPVHKSAPMETSEPQPEVPQEPFKPNAKVAVGVDPARFFQLLIPRLTGASAS